VVFFDGICGLCNGFVDFALARDRKGVFRFATLQGETFAAAMGAAGLAPETPQGGAAGAEGGTDGEWMKSIVLWDHRGFHRKSDAALRVIASLGGVWRLSGVLWAIPRPMRDLVYDYIARNRYRWFGKRETCRMPAPSERARFLP
jgi:predicted DCC family thiol-disulfide oxidoreductase YuxK